MSTTQHPIQSDQSVGGLASTQSGAARVFHRHGLDFCCGGQVSLGEACASAGLDVDTVIAEIQDEAQKAGSFERWDERPLPEVIDHILERYHEPHRQELPRLLAMARKVEKVHAEKSTCPRGLAELIERIGDEMELHMQREEQEVFPLLRGGRGQAAAIAIQDLEQEHQEHGKNLERLRELTGDYTSPPEACGTWSALYLGLAELQRELMEHIHTENNILFPRALRG